MFDLFVLRDATQRRVASQFEMQATVRAQARASVEKDGRSPRRTASARAWRVRPVSNR